MKVAIVGGSGAFGSALALRLTEAGTEVIVGSRDPGRAAATAAEVGAVQGLENADAVQDADLVVLSVDASAALSTSAELADSIGETPVLSVASQIRFANGAAFPGDDPTSLAERIQPVLRGPVVAGLHSLAASSLSAARRKATLSSAATTKTRSRRPSSSRRLSSPAALSMRARSPALAPWKA